MRLFLDDSVYSAFLRGHPDIKEVLRQADSIYLNRIVLGELLAGFHRGTQLRKNEEIRLSRATRPRTSFCKPRTDTVVVRPTVLPERERG